MTAKVAFLFPGQGSQQVGMGADVYESSANARHVFETFNETLGFSLSTLCFEGPADTLRSTINAQPAIVAVSLAYLAAFQEALSTSETASWSSPLTPSYTAGHSVGECTALVASGIADTQNVAYLVSERGRLMHAEELACPGGMAAIIGMDADALQSICEEIVAARKTTATGAHPGTGQVILANYNAPGQIVLSGEQQALEAACALAKERGAKRVIPLAVSGAFHSPVMQPAIEHLAISIQKTEIHDAQIPLISNISGTPLTHSGDIQQELAQQVATSVQWIKTIEYLVNEGITTFFEIGPGQALAGMIKRISRGTTTINIGSVADIEKAVALVKERNWLAE